jgi:mRNA interferase RelE/StbE
MARVVLARSARAQVLELNERFMEAVMDGLGLLEADPEVGRPLRGKLRGLWVLRIGVYRLIYQVRDNGKTVRVVAVRHRAHAYRTDPR